MMPCTHSSLIVLFLEYLSIRFPKPGTENKLLPVQCHIHYLVIHHPSAPSKMYHPVWLHKTNCAHLKHSLALSTQHTSQLFAVFLVWGSKTKEAKLHMGVGERVWIPGWGMGERTRKIYFIPKTKHHFPRILLPTLNQDFWMLTVIERLHFSTLHVLLCKVENWQIRGTCHAFQLQMFA